MEYFGKTVVAVNAVKINYIKITHKINKNKFLSSVLNLSIFVCFFVTLAFVAEIIKKLLVK